MEPAAQGGGPEDPRVYRNAAGKLQVSFGVLSNAAELAVMSLGDYRISMTPVSGGEKMSGSGRMDEEQLPVAGQLREVNAGAKEGSLESVILPRNRTGKLVYEKLFPTADLEYVVMSIGLKENIVLHQRSEHYPSAFCWKQEN